MKIQKKRDGLSDAMGVIDGDVQKKKKSGRITHFRLNAEDEEFAKDLRRIYMARTGKKLSYPKILHLAILNLMQKLEWDPAIFPRDPFPYSAEMQNLGLADLSDETQKVSASEIARARRKEIKLWKRKMRGGQDKLKVAVDGSHDRDGNTQKI